MQQPVHAAAEAIARSNEAATSATAAGDVAAPVGIRQLGEQASKVAIAQARGASRAEIAVRQKKSGLQGVREPVQTCLMHCTQCSLTHYAKQWQMALHVFLL